MHHHLDGPVEYGGVDLRLFPPFVQVHDDRTGQGDQPIHLGIGDHHLLGASKDRLDVVHRNRVDPGHEFGRRTSTHDACTQLRSTVIEQPDTLGGGEALGEVPPTPRSGKRERPFVNLLGVGERRLVAHQARDQPAPFGQEEREVTHDREVGRHREVAAGLEPLVPQSRGKLPLVVVQPVADGRFKR